jgi:predicted CopG family antitoxin
MPITTLYLKQEVYDFLIKEENKSAIVNDLLLKYYEKLKLGKMSIEEIDKRIEIADLEEELKKKKKELENATGKN